MRRRGASWVQGDDDKGTEVNWLGLEIELETVDAGTVNGRRQAERTSVYARGRDVVAPAPVPNKTAENSIISNQSLSDSVNSALTPHFFSSFGDRTKGSCLATAAASGLVCMRQ